MKSSHVAIAGGVFAGVLAACFVLVGLGKKKETSTPTPELEVAQVQPEPEPDVQLPTPNACSVVLGGFGQLTRTVKGYDASAALHQSSPSAEAVLAIWKLPSPDVREFGDIYREVRLFGDRMTTVSETGIRVMNALTGDPLGTGITVEKNFPATTLSPRGEWAAQSTATGVNLIDTTTGKVSPLTNTSKRTFKGAAGFSGDNSWCIVAGEAEGKPAFFRVSRWGDNIANLGTYHPDTERGDSARIARIYATDASSRIVIERPNESAPTARFLTWAPKKEVPVPVPAFDDRNHDHVMQFQLDRDGKRVLMFNEQIVKVVDIDSKRVLYLHEPEKCKIGGAAFSPDGSRLLVSYSTQTILGDTDNGEPEFTYVPGIAWVVDLASKATVGTTLDFKDMGVEKGFRRCVLSTDGTRLAIIETSGKVFVVDTNRAFGAGVLGGTASPNTPERKAPNIGSVPQPT